MIFDDLATLSNNDICSILNYIISLVEFQQSTTTFKTLKHVVKDKNDYELFSYYGQVVINI